MHPLEHGEAVDQRQTQVDHAQVEGLLEQQVLGHGPVVGHLHLEAGSAQVGRQGVGQDGIVLGKQQTHGTRLPCSMGR